MRNSRSFPGLSRLILVACLLGGAPAASAAEAEDHLFSGSKFAQEKKYKDAAREFEVAVGLDPENPEANLLLGLTLANTGDLEGAVRYSLKATRLKPGYAGYHNLGLIYSNQGEFQKAADAYRQALEYNDKSYQAWHQLGKVYSTMLDFENAVEAYGNAAQLNPKFPDAYQGLASAHYWSGNLSAALEQVDLLNKLGFASEGKELESWIKNNEAKKKKAAAKAGPKTA